MQALTRAPLALVIIPVVAVLFLAKGSGPWKNERNDVAAHGSPGDRRGDSKVAVQPSGMEGAGSGAFALQSFRKGELVGLLPVDYRSVEVGGTYGSLETSR